MMRGLQLAIALLICSSAVVKGSFAFGRRRPLVAIVPNEKPVTVPFQKGLLDASPNLPLTDIRTQKLVPGCFPEQVRLTYWSDSSVLVSWSSCDATVAPRAAALNASALAPGLVTVGKAPGAYARNYTSVATSYKTNYDWPAGKPEWAPPEVRAHMHAANFEYSSPAIHHALLTDLEPGVKYYYRIIVPGWPLTPDQSHSFKIGGDYTKSIASQEFSFTAPKRAVPSSLPLRLGFMGDPGVTANSTVTFAHLKEAKPDVAVLLGDFCYADETSSDGQSEVVGSSYQPLWDVFARLTQPLLSQVPLLHTPGNHEMEPAPNGAFFTTYNQRYPAPADPSKPPSDFAPVFAGAGKAPQKRANNGNMYYKALLPGVTLLSITSYIPGDDFSPASAQYQWLERELAAVDRKVTPWVLVMMHSPWYTSYNAHYRESDCMRQTYEPLLYKYGVDLVLAAHVHAYERMKPVYDFKVGDECAPAYLMLGDGGNVEGMKKVFMDAEDPEPKWCTDASLYPFQYYQPQGWEPVSAIPADKLWKMGGSGYMPNVCKPALLPDGRFCHPRGAQPEWSAYREPSFGMGTLDVLNATHARWAWRANQRSAPLDEVVFVRKPATCANTRGAAAAAAAATPKTAGH